MPGQACPFEKVHLGQTLLRQPVYATHSLKHAIRDLDHTRGTRAVVEYDGQELVVTQT